jgi:hypothetical protein
MSTTSGPQAAVSTLGADLMGDWSAIANWYANSEPAVQAAFKKAVADAKAAGSAIFTAVHNVLPAPATAKK